MYRMPYSRLLAIAALLFALSVPSFCQSEEHPWEKYYYYLAETEDLENTTWEDVYDALCDLEDNKIDLNRATREDFERILFLSPAQVEELCEYVYSYAPVRSLSELSMIESLSAVQRNLLSCFVYVSEDAEKQSFPTLGNILKHGRSELVAAAKVPLYDRKGDKNGYLGYKYKHWFRYSFKYGQFVQAGITGSQDSGEPLFAGRNKWGYDYYSAYVLIRKLGRLKTLALGRYRLKTGMGLIMNNDFSFGKMASLAVPNASNMIHAHSSRSEANYLQGAAATVSVAKGLDATAFVSYRKLDATPIDGTDSVRTILETGYHRTETEMAHKHNVSQTAAGANLRYFNSGFHVGMTAVFSSLGKTLAPDTEQEFRRWYLSGRDFFNASIDYGYDRHDLSFNGETALDDNASLATINRISYQPDARLTLTALYRFYSYKFRTFFGNCFNDGGRVQNESGVYVGATWSPLPRLSIMAYSDYAYFAWPKYQISSSSHSWDNLVAAAYQAGAFRVSARYRLRLRQRDNSDKTALLTRAEQRARLQIGYASETFSCTLQGDVCNSKYEESSFGWMLSQNIEYKHEWLKAYAAISYFHTDDYSSRLYAYEKGLLYTFSFPMLYGHGMRYTASLRAELSRNLLLICKAGTTKYFDRDTISSSYQQIDGSSVTDIEAQIKWKF